MVAITLRNLAFVLFGCWMYLLSSALPPVLYWQDVKMVAIVGSPAVLVQYKGIKATKAEFKLNGKRAGEVSLDDRKSEGEFRFSVPLMELQRGDNLVEVFLSDAEGKVLGSEKVVLTLEQAEGLPVRIKIPRMGETVSGTVEIHVDFGVQTRERYVSFFVDGEFRSLRNYPPFVFYWDTRSVPNGWHEVQVWLFDETQSTYKSPVVRLYVDNPGGRTERIGAGEAEGGVVVTPPVVAVPGNTVGLKMSPADLRMSSSTILPRVPAVSPVLSEPGVVPPVGRAVSLVGGYGWRAEAAGHRLAEPSAPREASPAIVEAVGSPTPRGMIRVEPGVRLNREGTFDVFYGGERVKFDVAPQVKGGIPFAPFRHLYEQAGGRLEWDNSTKVCIAIGADHDVWLQIGQIYAKVEGKVVQLETAPYIERGRTIVPLSFIASALKVVIEYDPETGHVLITRVSEGG